MSVQKTEYRQVPSTTAAGPSPVIWADCPWEELEGPNAYCGGSFKGFHHWNDFMLSPSVPSTTGVSEYALYNDTGVTVTALSAQGMNVGAIQVGGNDLDNDEGSISFRDQTSQIQKGSATGGVWFECRIKKASIADNALALFAGLGYDTGTLAHLARANTLIDDTGVLGAYSYLGFNTVHAAGETVNFVYRAEGQAITTPIAGVATMVADTYMNLGFKYHPQNKRAERIKVYVNGAVQSTYVTEANIAAATFPDGEKMAPLIATKVGASAESLFTIDWWRIASIEP